MLRGAVFFRGHSVDRTAGSRLRSFSATSPTDDMSQYCCLGHCELNYKTLWINHTHAH